MAYGLIFDVDGVIADSESLIAEATIAMFRDEYGHEFTAEDFKPFIGTGSVRYTLGPAEAAGIAIDLEKALDICHANFDRLVGGATNIAFPGAKELIEAAAASPEWRLAMATSSPKLKSEATLRATGIDTTLFNAWISGDMIKRPKPNAEIYVTAALAMQLPPVRCIAIEDAVNGIKAAKDACMKCVGVTTSFPAERLSGADHIVDSLTELNLGMLMDLINADKKPITWGARKIAPV